MLRDGLSGEGAVMDRMKAMMLAAAAVALAIGGRAEAQASCGVDEAPCKTADGVYHIERPDGPGPHPAVMFLHGWGGSGAAQIKSRRITGALLERGYAVIAPTGQPRGQDQSGYRWGSYGDHPFMEGLRDDVAFLSQVADDAAERFELDRQSIVLSGFSGGGMMTWRVACDAPEAFSAYAPVAGLLWRPLPETCGGPVRLFHTHGWIDAVVPLEGRAVAGGRLVQGDVFQGLDLMRHTNGCLRDDPGDYATTGVFQRRVWTDCAEGAALEFALHPGGHETPGDWAAMALDWYEAFDAVR